ncbi:MAG: hypothetical protein ACD_61C00185G0002 [uncultured bacterium]|nr:MAG: hypothetical protein ACD_61C00185G0002 [uncultured bacterium]
MRKIIWIVLILIALLWLAIANFWTGSKDTRKNFDFPEATPTLTTYPTEAPLASPSATTSAELNLNY